MPREPVINFKEQIEKWAGMKLEEFYKEVEVIRSINNTKSAA